MPKSYEFEWDESKAAANLHKHGISFELARTIFNDPNILTVADMEHSDDEDRWFSVGITNSSQIVAVAHLWTELEDGATQIRIISARKATKAEISYYQDNK